MVFPFYSTTSCLSFGFTLSSIFLTFLLGDDLAAEFRLSGLEVSAGLDAKSASLWIDINGKRKMWIVNPHPYLQVFGQLIPAIGVADTQ